MESGEIESNLSRSAVYGQTRADGAAQKNANVGTLTSHHAPDADLSQPARRGRLVLFDATDLHWCPDVGHSDVLQGAQRRVDSPGLANPWYALLGSLEYPTGEGLSTIPQRKRPQQVPAHWERLLERDPDAFWCVGLDNASAHTPPQRAPFWEAHKDRLCPIFQPTDSPHVNLIERLWRLMRGQMTRTYFYQRLKELAEAIVEWLDKLPFKQFCSLMGIHEQALIFVESIYS